MSHFIPNGLYYSWVFVESRERNGANEINCFAMEISYGVADKLEKLMGKSEQMRFKEHKRLQWGHATATQPRRQLFSLSTLKSISRIGNDTHLHCFFDTFKWTFTYGRALRAFSSIKLFVCAKSYLEYLECFVRDCVCLFPNDSKHFDSSRLRFYRWEIIRFGYPNVF